jgi:hypothetical protein
VPSPGLHHLWLRPAHQLSAGVPLDQLRDGGGEDLQAAGKRGCVIRRRRNNGTQPQADWNRSCLCCTLPPQVFKGGLSRAGMEEGEQLRYFAAQASARAGRALSACPPSFVMSPACTPALLLPSPERSAFAPTDLLALSCVSWFCSA